MQKYGTGRLYAATDIVGFLEPNDILVDHMRGRFKTWTRVRIDLQHVPVEQRPEPEPLDPDEDVNEW